MNRVPITIVSCAFECLPHITIIWAITQHSIRPIPCLYTVYTLLRIKIESEMYRLLLLFFFLLYITIPHVPPTVIMSLNLQFNGTIGAKYFFFCAVLRLMTIRSWDTTKLIQFKSIYFIAKNGLWISGWKIDIFAATTKSTKINPKRTKLFRLFNMIMKRCEYHTIHHKKFKCAFRHSDLSAYSGDFKLYFCGIKTTHWTWIIFSQYQFVGEARNIHVKSIEMPSV